MNLIKILALALIMQSCTCAWYYESVGAVKIKTECENKCHKKKEGCKKKHT